MTVFINMHVSCHDYEGIMSVLCTPLQVKCYRFFFIFDILISYSTRTHQIEQK